MKPRVFDSFPIAGTETELLLLECRLTELYDAVDAFIIVEARVDHQDHPKPLNYLANQDRFAPWKDKITYVVAETMPSLEDDSWSWAREHAQREWIAQGLIELDAHPDDVLLQSDLDEIPTAIVARNLRPQRNELISCIQRGHFWAIDWQYPDGWCGTVATRVGNLQNLGVGKNGPFAFMRETRNTNGKKLSNAGWHLSWLGGPEAALKKVNSFCHPEVAPRIEKDPEFFWREGVHCDFKKMKPVDVDKTWPKWLQNRANVPDSWFRPR